jgi:sulfur carrier protein ThiS
MDISVKLFGGLRSYLPPGSSYNSCTLKVDDGANLSALLAQIPIPAGKHFLVIVNDQKVFEADYDSLQIESSDEVVLLPPIKGG